QRNAQIKAALIDPQMASSPIQRNAQIKASLIEPNQGRISKITDPMGNITTLNFDACDNLRVVRHFGQTNDVPGTNGNIRLAESRSEERRVGKECRSRWSREH